MTSETRFNVSLLQTWPVRVGAGGSDAQRVEALRLDTRQASDEERRAQAEAAFADAQKTMIAGDLRIELDREAGRFVVTLTDPDTMAVLRRFPHESQLAYARAVSAYMNARNELL